METNLPVLIDAGFPVNNVFSGVLVEKAYESKDKYIFVIGFNDRRAVIDRYNNGAFVYTNLSENPHSQEETNFIYEILNKVIDAQKEP